MAIDFGNCNILSYNRTSNFLGDEIMRYKTTKSLRVGGLLLQLSASSGISGLITGQHVLEESANDWQAIVLRGVNFGSGKITSIDFGDTTDLRKESYEVTVDVFQESDITNFPTNDLYSGINYSNFQYITDLDEQISYSNDFETSNYTHSIDVGILTSNSAVSMQIAKELAANLFNADNILNVIGQYNTLAGKTAIYSEDYDEINIRCQFEKNVELFRSSSGTYTISKNYTYKRGEDGVIVVSEKGNILSLAEPHIDTLSSAFQAASGQIYNNCLQVFNSYADGDNYPLENVALTKGTSLNRFARTLDYEFIYSNNLNIKNGFFWNYTHDSNLNDKGLIQSNENGQIIGFGHIVDEKFVAAKIGYNSITGLIDARVQESYDRFRVFNSDFTNAQLFLTNKNEKFSPFNGRLEYEYSYNNDSNRITSPPELTRAEIIVTEGFRIPITQSFNIININEIEQISDADEVAQRTIQVILNGKRQATIQDYLDYLLSILPTYIGDFLTSVKYDFDPFTNTFTANVGFSIIYE